MSGTAFEKHYRVFELAQLWGFSDSTIINLFRDEPGVIRLNRSGAGRRQCVTMSIPESVALRVHEGIGQQPIKPSPLPTKDATRLMHLSDFGEGVRRVRGEAPVRRSKREMILAERLAMQRAHAEQRAERQKSKEAERVARQERRIARQKKRDEDRTARKKDRLRRASEETEKWERKFAELVDPDYYRPRVPTHGSSFGAFADQMGVISR